MSEDTVGKFAGQRLVIAGEVTPERLALAEKLRAMSAEVVEVSSGVDLLNILAQYHRRKRALNCIITTIAMPRMDGVAALRSIRENPLFTELPVIMLHTADEERKLHECRCLGIDAYFELPDVENKVIDQLTQMVNFVKERQVREVEKKTKQKIDEHPALSPLDFPYEFGGFPRPKNYALRLSYYRCPLCNATFLSPRLINRALKADQNDFMGIGLYTDGMERDFLEYLLVECLVCPVCLYAADKSGFLRIWTNAETTLTEAKAIDEKEWTPVYFSVNARLQEKLKETLPERLALAKTASREGTGLFVLDEEDPKIPRKPEDALIALDMAIKSAEQILPAQQRGEEKARLNQKISGYYLRQYQVYNILIKKYTGDKAKVNPLKQNQGKVLLAAMGTINSVNDVEFNVIEECLYCQTRRFFLADLLCQASATEEQKEKLAQLRKRALGAMRATLTRARQEKSENVKTIERFLLPLENRLIDLENEAAKAKAASEKK